MPWSLERRQRTGNIHFVTFSCFRRHALLNSPCTRELFEHALEKVRDRHDFDVLGYVVMPDHVHLLVSEPRSQILSSSMQVLKQEVSRQLRRRGETFWETRYHDFNVLTEEKRIEKLQYLHRNPVKRGLVRFPEQWVWSSFRHHATGQQRIVRVESIWTENERQGIVNLSLRRPVLLV